jgi:FMN phosphatase YigB (HAD superfamily)
MKQYRNISAIIFDLGNVLVNLNLALCIENIKNLVLPIHINFNVKREFAKIGKRIEDVFDKCYLSYEIGMAKPNAEIFQAVLADIGLKADEYLFIDDAKKNIDTAASLDIQTCLVKPTDSLYFLTAL